MDFERISAAAARVDNELMLKQTSVDLSARISCSRNNAHFTANYSRYRWAIIWQIVMKTGLFRLGGDLIFGLMYSMWGRWSCNRETAKTSFFLWTPPKPRPRPLLDFEADHDMSAADFIFAVKRFRTDEIWSEQLRMTYDTLEFNLATIHALQSPKLVVEVQAVKWLLQPDIPAKSRERPSRIRGF